jgi:hypothetical protein
VYRRRRRRTLGDELHELSKPPVAKLKGPVGNG